MRIEGKRSQKAVWTVFFKAEAGTGGGGGKISDMARGHNSP